MTSLEMFTSAIYTDKAVSLRQIRRFFDLDEADISEQIERHKFARLQIQMPRAVKSGRVEDLTLICRDARIATRVLYKIRHLVALAEFRRLVHAPPNKWVLKALENPKDSNGVFLSGDIPDAIWHSPAGTIAIEYDAGAHGSEVIAGKILEYANSRSCYASQIWFTGSAERARNIAEIAESCYVENIAVIVLRWWL
jgi:hypothetical protein